MFYRAKFLNFTVFMFVVYCLNFKNNLKDSYNIDLVEVYIL